MFFRLQILLVLCVVTGSAPPLELLGRFDSRTIPEASGIVKSRRYRGIFWVHNDSGNPPLLFAIRADGRIVRQFRLQVPNIDWEDIAIDDEGHLYLGDIGNNGQVLPVRGIYRIDEPDPASTVDEPLAASAATFYAMPKGKRFDAEGLFYECGSAIVVAKYFDQREAELFSVSFDPPSPLLRPAQPRSIGRLPGFTEPVTGASLSADRRLLAVCAPSVTRVYQRGQSSNWRLLSTIRYQARNFEGIAWDGGDLILVAEGQGVYRLRESRWRAGTAAGAAGGSSAASAQAPAAARGKDPGGKVVEVK